MRVNHPVYRLHPIFRRHAQRLHAQRTMATVTAGADSAMLSGADVHPLQLWLASDGGWAQGAATSQLVSTGQPAEVSQGLEPPLEAR